MRKHWFGHVDMDAFYASVEVLDDPSLSGLPLAVGGPAAGRGVIAAASYEARRYGVHSAMPTAQAQRLCPQLVLVPGRMERYQELSRQIMDILREHAPAVEPLSLDEASLDLDGCARLHGDWEAFAPRLQREVHERTGLWCSVGLGETRRIAKMASDLRKPRGCHIVPAGKGAAFLQSMPVGRLWGVGPALCARLEGLGLREGSDIAALSRSALQQALGRTGLALHDIVHAREGGRVHPGRASKSISHEGTFARDRSGVAELEPVLLHFSGKVARRMRAEGVLGRVVQLKARDRGFQTFTRRCTLPRPVDSQDEIFAAARRLWRELGWEGVPVRLLGVGVQQLSAAGGQQGELFATQVERERPRLDRVVDQLLDRFGEGAVARGGTLIPGSSPHATIRMGGGRGGLTRN